MRALQVGPHHRYPARLHKRCGESNSRTVATREGGVSLLHSLHRAAGKGEAAALRCANVLRILVSQPVSSDYRRPRLEREMSPAARAMGKVVAPGHCLFVLCRRNDEAVFV